VASQATPARSSLAPSSSRVKNVVKRDGRVLHELDRAGLKAGDYVRGLLDWDRRYRIMRMHTAAHLLSAIFYKEGGAMITGNQLDLDKSRIDFSLEAFERDRMLAFVAKANQYVRGDLPVKIYFLPRDEAMKIPEVIKLANVLPPSIDQLRIVEIEGIDMQADGGNHIKRLGEIGEIEALKFENKGKSNRRVYYTLK